MFVDSSNSDDLTECPDLDGHEDAGPVPGLGRVPHDVELLRPLLPGRHRRTLPLQHEHVQVPWEAIESL